MNGNDNEIISHGNIDTITNLKFRYYQNTHRLKKHIDFLVKENNKLKKELDELENSILEPNEDEINYEPALDMDEEDYLMEQEEK